MPRKRSAKSLVNAVLREEIDCDGAIEEHLNDNYRGRLEAPSLEIVHAALCYANRGQADRLLDLPDGAMTVAQVVEEFGLEPFAPLLDDKALDRHHEIRYPVGTLVDWEGSCRVIGRRQVTIFAMPREDEFEVFIETQEGTPLYFVGESMVGLVEDQGPRI